MNIKWSSNILWFTLCAEKSKTGIRNRDLSYKFEWSPKGGGSGGCGCWPSISKAFSSLTPLPLLLISEDTRRTEKNMNQICGEVISLASCEEPLLQQEDSPVTKELPTATFKVLTTMHYSTTVTHTLPLDLIFALSISFCAFKILFKIHPTCMVFTININAFFVIW